MSESAARAERTGRIALSDEDAVREVLVESVLGLWDVTLLREHHARWLTGSARPGDGATSVRA